MITWKDHPSQTKVYKIHVVAKLLQYCTALIGFLGLLVEHLKRETTQTTYQKRNANYKKGKRKNENSN